MKVHKGKCDCEKKWLIEIVLDIYVPHTELEFL